MASWDHALPQVNMHAHRLWDLRGTDPWVQCLELIRNHVELPAPTGACLFRMPSGSDPVVWFDAHDGISVLVPCVPAGRNWTVKIENEKFTLKVGDFLRFPSRFQREIAPAANFPLMFIVIWYGGTRCRMESISNRFQAITSKEKADAPRKPSKGKANAPGKKPQSEVGGNTSRCESQSTVPSTRKAKPAPKVEPKAYHSPPTTTPFCAHRMVNIHSPPPLWCRLHRFSPPPPFQMESKLLHMVSCFLNKCASGRVQTKQDA